MKQSVFAYGLAIALIVLLVFLIKNQVEEYQLQDDPILYLLKEVLTPIKYNGKSITEGLKLYKANKSYTINKDKTFLCVYDKNGNYYPLNMVVYVLLHEISHSLNTKDVGHTDAFYKIFDDLLKEATKLGIYNPSIPIIDDYCNYDG
jgi:hypothetical protein